MSNLISHKDTSIVSKAVVLAEPRPDFTRTWHPYSHGEVLASVGKACAKLGWGIDREQYAIRPGSKMFGIWDLKKESADSMIGLEGETLSIGIRNGIDRKMSVGLCAGVRVFVCDNMAFTGDLVLFRKHTGNLELDELDIMAEEALDSLAGRFEKVVKWHEDLRNVPLTAGQASTLVIAAMARKYPLIPPSKYPLFHKLYFEMERYTPTLHGFHGAITEMFQETAMIDLLWRTGLLVDFLNYEAPIILGGSRKTIFQAGRIPFEIVQDEAKELKDEARIGAKVDNKATQAEVMGRVQARLKEARMPDIDDSSIVAPYGPGTSQEGPKAKGKGKGKAKPKKAAQVKKEKAEKKPRRTARVKIREKIAAESKPVKTSKVKPVKAEKVTTAKAAERKLKAATAADPEGDLYFCEDCRGEFTRDKIKVVGTDYVCERCLEGRKEAKVIGKSKKK